MTGEQTKRDPANASGGATIDVELNQDVVYGHAPSPVSSGAARLTTAGLTTASLTNAGLATARPAAARIPRPTPPPARKTASGCKASPLLRWAGIAAATGLIAAVAVAMYSPPPPETPPPPVVLQPAAPAATEPAPAPEPQGPPVQYRNPFDRSEVFEFPPGTSRDDARKAVSDILMQRAQERGIRKFAVKMKRDARVAQNGAESAPAASHAVRAGR